MKITIKTWVAVLAIAVVLPAMMFAGQDKNASPAASGINLTPQPATSSPAPTPTANNSGALMLPAGSTLHVRLGTTLTSKTNKTGDKFTGYVEKPVIVNGITVVPEGSLVDGHVAFVKAAKRVKGVGQMRIVLDDVTTADNNEFLLNGTLDNAQGSPCAKTGSDEEGTIKGCGKSTKDALKGAAIGGAMGAGAGATVGMGHEIDCQYFGNCGGPSFGADLGYGAAIGAGAAVIYNIFKHEKPLILLENTELTFIVSRSVPATKMPATAQAADGAN